MAATQFAMAHAGLESFQEDGERLGVYVGSGIGGFEVIEREHLKLLTAALTGSRHSSSLRRCRTSLPDRSLFGTGLEVQVLPARLPARPAPTRLAKHGT